MSTEQNSGQNDDTPLENGAEIIKRFGGIRPMAGKIDIPVTTVQGWKKRDTIPAARRDLVLAAARDHDIDLSGLVPEAVSGPQTTEKTDPVQSQSQTQSQTESQTDASTDRDMIDSDKDSATNTAGPDRQETRYTQSTSETGQASQTETENYVTMTELNKKLAEMRKTTYIRAFWTSLVLIVLTGAAGAFLLWPEARQIDRQIETNNQRLVSLENEVSDIDRDVGDMKGKLERNSQDTQIGDRDFFGGFMPEDMNRRLQELGEQTGDLKDQVTELSTRTMDFAKQVQSLDQKDLQARLDRLEREFRGFANSRSVRSMLTTLQSLQGSADGRQQLEKAMSQLRGLVVAQTGAPGTDEGAGGDESVRNSLQQALKQIQGTESPLGKSLEGVDDKNLKAAAMLLAFSQVRSAFGRDRKSFEEDLKVLQSLVDKDNAELKTALERLAPKAKDGVLSSKGLSRELRGLSGEIVVASLKGEDVSIQEKAKARLNELLEVKKDGELVTGNDTQKKIVRAQRFLDEGNVEAALEELNSLEGESRQAASPIIDEAQANLLAKKVEDMMSGTLARKLTGPSGTANADQIYRRLKRELDRATSPGVQKDEESGYVILPKSGTDFLR